MTDAASVLDCRSGSILPEGGTMPDVPRLRERVNRSLRVRIIVHGGSETLYEQFAAALTLRREATADFLLTIELRDAPSAAVFVEQVGQLAQREDALLIVSDRFTPNPDGAGQDLARLLREATANGRAIMALLGVVDPPLKRICLVDSCVPRDADAEVLSRAVERALGAIRYKVPPAERPHAGSWPVEVREVGDLAELQKCLALRYAVYRLLGYLCDSTHMERTGWELNYFDQSALHFVAVAPGEGGDVVAGTARLILADAKIGRGGLFGDRARIRRRYGALCEQIVGARPELNKELERGPSAALPLLASFDYGELVTDPNVAVGDLCELSRVVVAEKFRGHGVSRLLVRACIAAAIELKQRYILLECIPQHARMYEKYGFERAGENHQRAWGIDQLATVMRLALNDVPTNEAVQVAKRDVAMMRVPRPRVQPPGSLCLCGLSLCWEHGNYGNRGMWDCPLKTNFVH